MTKENISEYYLERYVLGELPEDEAKEIQKLISKDAKIRSALEEIKASNENILSLYSPLTIKAGLLARMDQSSKKPFFLRRLLYLSTAFATVFLVFILIFPILKKETRIKYLDNELDVSTVKGIQNLDLTKTQLLVFRQNQDLVEVLKNGEQAKTGDLLQLAYIAVEELYGMILSIDGRGQVTLHFPVEIGNPTYLTLHKKTLLPNAIELDDAPSFERFFFITSVFDIDVDRILKISENLAKDLVQAEEAELDLPENFKQYSILIRKGEGL